MQTNDAPQPSTPPQPDAAGQGRADSRTNLFDLDRAGVKLQLIDPGFVRTPSMVDRSYPTPGMIDADVAADHIVRRLPAAPAWIDFPWSTAWAARLLRVLPRSLLHAVLRRWVTVGSP